MKALVKKFKKPGIWLDEVPMPEYGQNDVLIKIQRTAICGTDIHIYNWDEWARKTIPVPMVVGHERRSKYNRINQSGPEEMGWRTTAQNLNLNRDWLKADAPEMQAMLKLFSEWLPDFLIDSHTTNGADYQYSLTYAVEKHQNIYSETADWLKKRFIPFLETRVKKKGFLIHPYIYLKKLAVRI